MQMINSFPPSPHTKGCKNSSYTSFVLFQKSLLLIWISK
uniref:Uncharacterized protein n=1 Tax=Manihot esculenta TaxID=3983 RepID=A0A2C9VGA2_MANES